MPRMPTRSAISTRLKMVVLTLRTICRAHMAGVMALSSWLCRHDEAVDSCSDGTIGPRMRRDAPGTLLRALVPTCRQRLRDAVAPADAARRWSGLGRRGRQFPRGRRTLGAKEVG